MSAKYIVPFAGLPDTTPIETPEPLPECLQALRYFRILATEFHERPDDEVCIWLEMTTPIVAPQFFRAMYLQALALLTAHRMKMAEMAQDEADGIHPVSSIKEDGGSMTFAINQPSLSMDNATLMLTVYGKAYLEIRSKMVAGPIM